MDKGIAKNEKCTACTEYTNNKEKRLNSRKPKSNWMIFLDLSLIGASANKSLPIESAAMAPNTIHRKM